MAIETALIAAPSRAGNSIFGLPLLERLLISCRRAGMKRFVIESPSERSDDVRASLGRFRDDPALTLVDRFDPDALSRAIDPSTACVAFSGNLVFFKSQLNRVLRDHEADPSSVHRHGSADADQGGEIATGPLAKLLGDGGLRTTPLQTAVGALPFALNGRPEDREEAELRLARSVREESVGTDAAMARLVDRNLSWRISYRLARTRVTPNQVTIANTFLGLFAGWMFTIPSYGWRLVASLLFLLSITIDGVDGELARLKMCESDFGGKLDVVTDNVVHVAIFAGVFIGTYRASANSAFLWLMAIQLSGFALATLATYLALTITGKNAERWLATVDRVSGRDFAYLLVGFAALGKLDWFCWGTAFGTHIFAWTLLVLTARRRGRSANDRRSAADASLESES